jgi:hypothetical protein
MKALTVNVVTHLTYKHYTFAVYAVFCVHTKEVR